MGWKREYKYRIIGSLYEQDGELAYIFDAADSEAYFNSFVLPSQETDETGEVSIQPFMASGKRIRAIPEEWTTSFGMDFYLHELSLAALEGQSEQDWKLRLEGRLFETGKKMNITSFEVLRDYIKTELNGITIEEATT